MKQPFLFISAILLWSACNTTTTVPESSSNNRYYNIDSLLNEQITFLKNSKAMLHKTYRVDELLLDEVSVELDSTQWSSALSVFRVLDINKASLIDAYQIMDHVADSSSNLTILQYLLKDPKSNVPLKELNLYYLHSIQDLKKVVGKSGSSSFIYQSEKTLKLVFDKSYHQTSLKAYSISTNQKTLFRDSTFIHVDFDVTY